MTQFDSLVEVIMYFDTEEKCLRHLEEQRWGGEPVCPHCEYNKVYRFSDGVRFKCADCRKQFTVKTHTIFEDTKISLKKWMIASYLLVSHKKGISSHQLARDIHVTQKTAWHILHRIRFGMGLTESEEELDDAVQADETFIGGKNKNRHANKKVESSQGRAFKDKTPVMGLLEQELSYTVIRPHKVISDEIVQEKIIVKHSRVCCRVMKDTKAESIQPFVYDAVAPGATLVTDEWYGYQGLENDYQHSVVDHRVKQYVNGDGLTSNAVEGFWSIVKRSYIGIYHYLSRKHLWRYMTEAAFRYNNRHQSQGERINLILQKCNQRLTYKTLIAPAA